MAPKEEASVYDLAYRGKIEAVKILLNENEKLKTETDSNGRTLLHWAALGGWDNLVLHLLSIGVPVDSPDDTNMTPLILAASAGRDKVVRILLKEGVNVNAKSDDGHSALQYAASKNWLDICGILIENDADINIADKRGATPLHRAASKGNLHIVTMLLAHCDKIKIDQTDIYGNTALHLACEEDRRDEAKLLVSKGANIELTNKQRQTPLDLANPTLVRQIHEIKEKMSNETSNSN